MDYFRSIIIITPALRIGNLFKKTLIKLSFQRPNLLLSPYRDDGLSPIRYIIGIFFYLFN